MTTAKIYSLNLAAFLLLTTGIVPLTEKDPIDPSRIYFIFPNTPSTAFVIQAYRRTNVSIDLHNYLQCYRKIRNLTRTAKNGN
jgi:hypothetical protein